VVVAGYGLAYAALLIIGGRLGDLYGRRRIFRLGLAVFTLASAVCGLAPTAASLIAARAAQGVGAALLAPQVLAILGTIYVGADRAAAQLGNALGVALLGLVFFGVLGQHPGAAYGVAFAAGLDCLVALALALAVLVWRLQRRDSSAAPRPLALS
jgi:MFS family permease